MISFLLTLSLFPIVGAAAALLLRLPLPPSRAARVAFLFLLGLGAHGTVLYALGSAGVPLDRIVMVAVPLFSLVVIALQWRRFETLPRGGGERHPLAMLVFALPFVVLLYATAVVPTRDYDGRVTWLPKARAIALEDSIAGPFFHGQRGINLHNRYPLLLPLDAATLMRLTGDARSETPRWLYVLIPLAALLVMRAMLHFWFGATGVWMAAMAAWLPALTAVEGGALAAYNDFALAAFTGVAMLYLIEALNDPRALRVAGVFAAFAVMTKNEGVALAMALVAAAVAAWRWKSVAAWLQLLVPIAIAEGIVVYWRTLVPAAYDEQYEVLIASLPRSLERAPGALLVLVRYAGAFSEWGCFWLAVTAAVIVCAVLDRSKQLIIPFVTIAVALSAYAVALTVTSWSIADLAPVAVHRLLAHLLIPGLCILATAVHALGERSKKSDFAYGSSS